MGRRFREENKDTGSLTSQGPNRLLPREIRHTLSDTSGVLFIRWVTLPGRRGSFEVGLVRSHPRSWGEKVSSHLSPSLSGVLLKDLVNPFIVETSVSPKSRWPGTLRECLKTGAGSSFPVTAEILSTDVLFCFTILFWSHQTFITFQLFFEGV